MTTATPMGGHLWDASNGIYYKSFADKQSAIAFREKLAAAGFSPIRTVKDFSIYTNYQVFYRSTDSITAYWSALAKAKGQP